MLSPYVIVFHEDIKCLSVLVLAIMVLSGIVEQWNILGKREVDSHKLNYHL